MYFRLTIYVYIYIYSVVHLDSYQIHRSPYAIMVVADALVPSHQQPLCWFELGYGYNVTWTILFVYTYRVIAIKNICSADVWMSVCAGFLVVTVFVILGLKGITTCFTPEWAPVSVYVGHYLNLNAQVVQHNCDFEHRRWCFRWDRHTEWASVQECWCFL